MLAAMVGNYDLLQAISEIKQKSEGKEMLESQLSALQD